MLARFDDSPALDVSEASTTPLPPAADVVTAAPPLPEPEPTPRAERSAAAQPFAPETMFGTGEKPGEKRSEQPGDKPVEKPSHKPSDKPGEKAAEKAAEKGVPKREVGEALRPSPPPPGIAAKLAGPSSDRVSDAGPADSDVESDVASIEGRSGRGRRRTPKLGDLLTEALRAYQDVRDADEAQDSLAHAAEPSELGATELGSWLGTGTEPLGSIDPPSWRPGSSTRSFGVARHSSGDDAGPAGADWNPPIS